MLMIGVLDLDLFTIQQQNFMIQSRISSSQLLLKNSYDNYS